MNGVEQASPQDNVGLWNCGVRVEQGQGGVGVGVELTEGLGPGCHDQQKYDMKG